MKEDTVLTPASSTPPSDAEVIERVLELEDTFENSNATEAIKRASQELRMLTPDLAVRLRTALTRISSLERELGASDAALLSIEGPDWDFDDPKHHETQEAARRRRAT